MNQIGRVPLGASAAAAPLIVLPVAACGGGEGVNAFGASWYVLSPTGNQVTAAGPSGSTSSSGGAGGY